MKELRNPFFFSSRLGIVEIFGFKTAAEGGDPRLCAAGVWHFAFHCFVLPGSFPLLSKNFSRMRNILLMFIRQHVSQTDATEIYWDFPSKSKFDAVAFRKLVVPLLQTLPKNLPQPWTCTNRPKDMCRLWKFSPNDKTFEVKNPTVFFLPWKEASAKPGSKPFERQVMGEVYLIAQRRGRHVPFFLGAKSCTTESEWDSWWNSGFLDAFLLKTSGKKHVLYFTGVISHGTHFGWIKVDANVW